METKYGIEIYKTEVRNYYDAGLKRWFWGKWVYGRRISTGALGWTCVEGSDPK